MHQYMAFINKAQNTGRTGNWWSTKYFRFMSAWNGLQGLNPRPLDYEQTIFYPHRPLLVRVCLQIGTLGCEQWAVSWRLVWTENRGSSRHRLDVSRGWQTGSRHFAVPQWLCCGQRWREDPGKLSNIYTGSNLALTEICILQNGLHTLCLTSFNLNQIWTHNLSVTNICSLLTYLEQISYINDDNNDKHDDNKNPQ